MDVDAATTATRGNRDLYLIVILCSALIYLACIISPPHLQDDVDSVQAQIARNMLTSGDYVTARLDGVPYLEKAPLVYWLIAGSYKVFGVHDWAARIPIALSSIALAWLTAAIGVWAFGRRAGLYAGLTIAICVGLFLFTRVLIPDVMLTFTIGLAMWAFLRALDEDEPHPRRWAAILAASMGVGLLLKSLIGAVFPVGAGAGLPGLYPPAYLAPAHGNACTFSAAPLLRWPLLCRGTCWPRCAIRRTSPFRCTADRASITASCGSTSSTNSFCAF